MDNPTSVSPTQAAEAAVAGVLQARAEEAAKARADELDIRDPSVPPATLGPVPSSSAPRKAEPLPGASVETHPARLLEQAQALGYTEEEAKQIPVAVLRKTVAQFERTAQVQESPIQYGPGGEIWDGYRWHYPQQTPQVKEPDFPNLREWKSEDGQTLEPTIVEAFEKQQAHLTRIQKQNEELAQSMRQQQQNFTEAQRNSFYKEFDGHLAELKEYEDVLGKGTIYQIDEAAKQARQEVDIQVQALVQNYNQRGIPVPDLKTLATRAAAALYGSRAEQKANAQLEERMRNRSGQFIAKPSATSRNDEMPFGRDRAIAAVAAKQREQRNGN